MRVTAIAPLIVLAVIAALRTAPTFAKDVTPQADDPLLDFVVGDYATVGRNPGGGTAYTGSARIERVADGLLLTETRSNGRIKAAGRIEVPSPPGEVKVLRFRWRDPEPTTMTCLVAGDLDNYARMTCLWQRDGREQQQPGLEAMFSTTAWPDAGGKP
jgi:hypothetical protein